MLQILKNNQLMRFLVIGGINTMFGYLLYALFIFLNLSYPLASLLAWIFGVCWSYTTFSSFVFDKGDARPFGRFIGVYIFAYLFNIALITAFNYLFNNLYLAGFLSTFFVAGLNFTLNKTIVFKARPAT